jgi:hypothetical protein
MLVGPWPLIPQHVFLPLAKIELWISFVILIMLELLLGSAANSGIKEDNEEHDEYCT